MFEIPLSRRDIWISRTFWPFSTSQTVSQWLFAATRVLPSGVKAKDSPASGIVPSSFPVCTSHIRNGTLLPEQYRKLVTSRVPSGEKRNLCFELEPAEGREK